MDLQFRRATIADVNAIVEIEEACFSMPWSFQSFWGELDNNPHARYLVAELNGKIIGYAGVWIIFEEGHVTNIAIHPAYRGQKYGERLVNQLIDLTRAYGVTSMTLEVRVSNLIAMGLYKKLGFEARGRRKAYYDDNKEDAIVMWKDSL
jgi:ribosomal-protein-alanine N-acetyltransferase